MAKIPTSVPIWLPEGRFGFWPTSQTPVLGRQYRCKDQDIPQETLAAIKEWMDAGMPELSVFEVLGYPATSTVVEAPKAISSLGAELKRVLEAYEAALGTVMEVSTFEGLGEFVWSNKDELWLLINGSPRGTA